MGSQWVDHYNVLFLYRGGMQKYNYWSSQRVRDHRFPNMHIQYCDNADNGIPLDLNKQK